MASTVMNRVTHPVEYKGVDGNAGAGEFNSRELASVRVSHEYFLGEGQQAPATLPDKTNSETDASVPLIGDDVASAALNNYPVLGYKRTKVVVYKSGRISEIVLVSRGEVDGVSTNTASVFMGVQGTGANGAWSMGRISSPEPNGFTTALENAEIWLNAANDSLAALEPVVTALEVGSLTAITATDAAIKAIVAQVQRFMDTLHLGLYVTVLGVPYGPNIPAMSPGKMAAFRQRLGVEKDWFDVTTVGEGISKKDGFMHDAGGAPALLSHLTKSLNSGALTVPYLPPGSAVAGFSLVFGGENLTELTSKLYKLVRVFRKMGIISKEYWQQLGRTLQPFPATWQNPNHKIRDLRYEFYSWAGAGAGMSGSQDGTFKLRWELRDPLAFGDTTIESAGKRIIYRGGPPRQYAVWMTLDPALAGTDPLSNKGGRKENGTSPADKWIPVSGSNAKPFIGIARPYDTNSNGAAGVFNSPEREAGNFSKNDENTEISVATIRTYYGEKDPFKDKRYAQVYFAVTTRYDDGQVIEVSPKQDGTFPEGDALNNPENASLVKYIGAKITTTEYVTAVNARGGSSLPVAVSPEWAGVDLFEASTPLGAFIREGLKLATDVVGAGASNLSDMVKATAAALRLLIQEIQEIAVSLRDLVAAIKELAELNITAYGRVFYYPGEGYNLVEPSAWLDPQPTRTPTGKAALIQEYTQSLAQLPLQDDSDICFGVFGVLDTLALPAEAVRTTLTAVSQLLGLNFNGVDEAFREVGRRFKPAEDVGRTPEEVAAALASQGLASQPPGRASQGLGRSERTLLEQGVNYDWNCPPMVPVDALTNTSALVTAPASPTNESPATRFAPNLQPIFKR